MKAIPSNDLFAQYTSTKKEIDTTLKEIIRKSAFIGGEYVEKLEKELAKFCDTKYAIGVNSGTDALYLSLWACGISKGDEVITTPFTFFATVEVIARLGAIPVFVDIDPQTFNINPSLIEKKITKKTRAIIPVHLYGLVADMEPIQRLAKKYKLHIIEDACQAIGATYKNKKAGSFGTTGCFSFYPTKNLSAWGDGGLITTSSKKVARQLVILRNHGSLKKYYNDHIGTSSRLDGIQAAILLAKFKHLDSWNKKRLKIAGAYSKKLSKISWLRLSTFDGKKQNHVFHQFTVRVTNGKRDKLQEYLKEKGISTIIYYPIPLHLLKALKYLGYKRGDFPVAEKAAKEVLSLPIYPELKLKQLSYIVEKISAFR